MHACKPDLNASVVGRVRALSAPVVQNKAVNQVGNLHLSHADGHNRCTNEEPGNRSLSGTGNWRRSARFACRSLHCCWIEKLYRGKASPCPIIYHHLTADEPRRWRQSETRGGARRRLTPLDRM